MTDEHRVQDKLFAVVTHRRFLSIRSVCTQDDSTTPVGWFIEITPRPIPGTYKLGKQGPLEEVLDEALRALKEFDS
jgi:hypothetical protein